MSQDIKQLSDKRLRQLEAHYVSEIMIIRASHRDRWLLPYLRTELAEVNREQRVRSRGEKLGC